MLVAAIVLPALLCAAAYGDARRRRIPHALTIAIAVAGLLHASVDGRAIVATTALVACMVVGLALQGRGVIGGGDVKLVAACAPWLDVATATDALLLTAIAGGALGAYELVVRARRTAAADRLRPATVDAAPRRARSVPYGVAIAVGVLVAVTTRAGSAP